VRVYRENQEITRTDQHGRALIPRLRGYQKNVISIAQEDLPLDAEVDTLQLRLTPALRSAVVLDFPVRRSRSASFRLIDEDGRVPAPGTMVQLEADKREFPIGYDGRVFISGLNLNNRLFSVWSGRRCSLEITLNDTKELLPDLGTLICKGVPP
jgi:outer membrane usher protein